MSRIKKWTISTSEVIKLLRKYRHPRPNPQEEYEEAVSNNQGFTTKAIEKTKPDAEVKHHLSMCKDVNINYDDALFLMDVESNMEQVVVRVHRENYEMRNRECDDPYRHYSEDHDTGEGPPPRTLSTVECHTCHLHVETANQLKDTKESEPAQFQRYARLLVELEYKRAVALRPLLERHVESNIWPVEEWENMKNDFDTLATQAEYDHEARTTFLAFVWKHKSENGLRDLADKCIVNPSYQPTVDGSDSDEEDEKARPDETMDEWEKSFTLSPGAKYALPAVTEAHRVFWDAEIHLPVDWQTVDTARSERAGDQLAAELLATAYEDSVDAFERLTNTSVTAVMGVGTGLCEHGTKMTRYEVRSPAKVGDVSVAKCACGFHVVCRLLPAINTELQTTVEARRHRIERLILKYHENQRPLPAAAAAAAAGAGAGAAAPAAAVPGHGKEEKKRDPPKRKPAAAAAAPEKEAPRGGGAGGAGGGGGGGAGQRPDKKIKVKLEPTGRRRRPAYSCYVTDNGMMEIEEKLE